MNKTNFNQTGGFPLKTERLQELQTSFSSFNAFGGLAGNLTIISGCETVGTTVKNGFVFIEGELLEFREASGIVESSQVIIIDEKIDRAFENGIIKTVHVIRYATIGNADTSWLWSDFKRPIETKSLEERLSLMEKKLSIFQPGGAVFAWFRPVAEIPQGFQEVLDMRGRTVFGFDPAQSEFNQIGKTGGIKNKTLSIAEMPSHTHSFEKFNSDGSGSGSQYPTTGRGDEAGGGIMGMNPAGNSQSFSILNPYRVAAYIEFIG